MSTISASSPVKETPPQSAEPQDSADPDSSSQESPSSADASKDAPTPKPDLDAWIQVEKRHRQPPGKAKVSSASGFGSFNVDARSKPFFHHTGESAYLSHTSHFQWYTLNVLRCNSCFLKGNSAFI